MTQLLEKAFKEASKLSEEQQNRVATWLLEELASEVKWDTSFAASADKLAMLADEALVEFKSGQTKVLKLEEL